MTTDTKNFFVKPDEQNQACLSSAMARKRRRSQRAGGAAVVIELMEQREQSQTCLCSAESRQKKTKGQHGGSIIIRDVISDLHTTEFRMILTLMAKVMNTIPNDSDILFLTNVAYILNFDLIIPFT